MFLAIVPPNCMILVFEAVKLGITYFDLREFCQFRWVLGGMEAYGLNEYLDYKIYRYNNEECDKRIGYFTKAHGCLKVVEVKVVFIKFGI